MSDAGERTRDVGWWPIGVAAAGLLGFGLFVGGLVLMVNGFWAASADFRSGEIVQSVLTGDRGQVIRPWCRNSGDPCEYLVRFAVSSQQTQTRLLGPDGDIKLRAFSVIRMRAFEIERAQRSRR